MDLLVNVDVPDVGRAVAFYVGAFSLTVMRRFGGDGLGLSGSSHAWKPALDTPSTRAIVAIGKRAWFALMNRKTGRERPGLPCKSGSGF